MKDLVKDPEPSRKITAIKLLAFQGKLTDEERISIASEFDEILGKTAKSCPDGVDLVSGMVPSFPQAVYRILIQEGMP